MLKEDQKNIRTAGTVVLCLVTFFLIGLAQERIPFIIIFWLAMILLFSIGMGIGLLIMQIAGISRKKIGWIYHTIGLINLVFGSIGIFFLANNEIGLAVKIISLLIGLIMYRQILQPEKAPKGEY